MNIFDQDLFYVNNPTVEERKQIAKIVVSQNTRQVMTIMNYVVNIGIPLVVCALTKCNLIAAAVAFILTDIVLCTIDHYVVVIKPHDDARKCLLSYSQNNLKEKGERRDALSTELALYKNGSKCSSCEEESCKDCETKAKIDEYEELDTYLKFETEWVEQKLTPIKEEEMREEQKPAKDYSDKKAYFVTMEEKIAYFISNHKLSCLKPVLGAVDSLMDTLDTKPNGYELVPTTLYIYMDELQKILSKMVTLADDQALKYVDELERVSNALSQNINHLVERIRNMETSDIEVSLSVLIKELEGELSGNV